eukprot:CAMPEP_0201941762 /NCGR_PEP_ID=MMETSP0903-20130614/47665_1 /ASSEMBLY_ACC=CAM_ASM_000552 /TAXON_ID=420261 /ORGANISM="Thalassiosira antarctica, Strain CCMP982" /LENGTH=253 /DNA_ID=CAMNT_0048483905 /DNA_START=132 /DNA_END=893 /DNA_ORIENTATION=+
MMLVTAAHLMGRRGEVHAFRAASRLSNHNYLRFPPSCFAPRPAMAAVGQTNNHYTTLSPYNGHLSYPSTITTRLREHNNDSNEIDPTWTYVPYQTKPPPKRRPPIRRNFSTSAQFSEIPNSIPIPEDKLTISFTRASGAGGQNVNKVSSKVELRFHLPSSTWIPEEVRTRLQSNESNRINNEGFMTVTSQEHRTQLKNRKEAMKKLEDIVKNSWVRPKVRNMRKGLSKISKQNRREDKKKNSMKKENRRQVDF